MRIKTLYIGATWLFLLFGAAYIFLAPYYMGLSRDIAYREYIIETSYLGFLNFYLVALGWAFMGVWMVYRYLHVKHITYLIHMVLFMFICAVTLAFTLGMISTMPYVVLSLFGVMHIKIR